MMQTIFKYGPIPSAAYSGKEPQTCEARGQLVHADMQNGNLFVWSVLDDQKPDETRRLVFVPTGMTYSGERRFTVMDGPYVWHVIEVAP